MKAHELITLLQTLNPDTDISISVQDAHGELDFYAPIIGEMWGNDNYVLTSIHIGG